MTIIVTHAKVSSIPDDPVAVAAGEVVPTDWNAQHSLTGVGTMAEQNANAVAITGGTESGVTHSGDTIGTYLDHTATSAPSYVEGRTWYDSTAHALTYYNDSSTATVHIGQDLQFKVINNTGSSIANGSPVYITGTSSGQTYPNIALAKADVAGTANVAGLTNGSIANGAIGYVTAQGVIDNVNTGTFTVGQVLYLSPYSAGQLMNTVPPTGITVQVGIVSYVNTSTGKIYVKQTTPLAVSASILTGQVALANGGTNANLTASAGSVPYSTSTAIALSAVGTTGQVLTSQGASAPIWTTTGAGTVTSVGGTGTVNGLTLTGTVTSSGNLSLGGTLDLSSPPAIGSTAANTGAFTTLSASSTVSGTGFSTYLASPPAIGGTTPAAGTFTTLIGGGGSANYQSLVGAATTKTPVHSVAGSDANIALAFQSKGTGAIDLAAGSSGVNISNGGTVTAVTATSTGSLYTGFPTWSASAPTTAGGTTASGTVTTLAVYQATLVSGGTGYTAGDIITVVGGSGGSAQQLQVLTVSGGVIQTISGLTINTGVYTSLPSSPAAVTGGTGSGATISLTYRLVGGTTGLTIGTAGSGYVEQPTVTFSGGGGSGAAAYATVGAGTTIKSVGSTMSFTTPAGEQFRVIDNANPTVYWQAFGSAGNAILRSTAAGLLQSSGANQITFQTNQGSTQFNIAHTTSAVNYVQVTGAATGNQPSITAQGSDASVILNLASKGVANIIFNANSAEQFRTGTTASAVNSIQANGAPAGSSPSFQARGTDTDVDLALTPKGAGAVRFGTYTASVLTPTGYITIKDSGGTTRRLLVG
jgi:hypothetical protein